MSERVRDDEALTWRYLVGEGTGEERAAFARRLATEPTLARRLDAARRTWTGLELPPVAPAPPDFAFRVAARARSLAGGTGARPMGRLPARLAAVAALLVGIALGSALSWRVAATDEDEIAATTIAARYLAAADETSDGIPSDAAGAADATDATDATDAGVAAEPAAEESIR